MSRQLKSRDDLLDAMAYVFIYSADPATLDPVEQLETPSSPWVSAAHL